MGLPRRVPPGDCGVSILVFVELALDGQYADTQWLALIPVSILVFVELALDDLFSGSAGLPVLVSILVFVELALDV